MITIHRIMGQLSSCATFHSAVWQLSLTKLQEGQLMPVNAHEDRM